jgi:diaminopimelate decarboxylase
MRLNPVLLTAAETFGTPAYVMDMAAVASAAAAVESAFGPPWILQYSLKANDLPAIAAFLHQRGWGANVVSTGEWQFAGQGGVPNEATTFEGIGKTDAQLEHAVLESAAGRPLRWLAIESLAEAERLAELSDVHGLGRAGRPAVDVLFRLNPQVSPETRAEFAVGRGASKFGMTETEILALLSGGTCDRPGLRVRGIHVHTGSDLQDVAAWATAGLRATRLLSQIAAVTDTADTVDYGGGFPLSAASAPRPAEFVTALTSALHRDGLTLPARPAIEPGRFLVGAAGWLVTSVLHARAAHDGAGLAQAVLDAGMTEFIRPALYGSHHPAHALSGGEGWPADSMSATSLEGPICESTDTFGIHQLPALRRGDVIAIENAGAYAASFTSRYNGRPAPAEVLLWPDGSLESSPRPEIVASIPASFRAAPLNGPPPAVDQPHLSQPCIAAN